MCCFKYKVKMCDALYFSYQSHSNATHAFSVYVCAKNGEKARKNLGIYICHI